MAYVPLAIAPGTPPNVAKAIRDSIELYLRDVHAMIRLPNGRASIDAGCNYAAALMLFSVIASVSRFIHPRQGQDAPAFVQLLSDNFFPWPDEPPGCVHKSIAPTILYKEFRNTLVHTGGLPIKESNSGKVRTYVISASPDVFKVKKYRGIPERKLAAIERSNKRPNWGPTVLSRTEKGRNVTILLVEGLYWGTRHMICNLTRDTAIMQAAEALLTSPEPQLHNQPTTPLPIGYTTAGGGLSSDAAQFSDSPAQWSVGSGSTRK